MTETSKISEVLYQLKLAQDNLSNLRSELKGNDTLLSIYESSALFIVQQFETQVKQLLSKEYHISVPDQPTSSPDFWIRIEGNDFHNGKGPINFIGTFLNKFYGANKQLLHLLSEKISNFNVKDNFNFDLVATDVGSLKLGLRTQPEPTEVKLGQIEIDYDPWDELVAIAKKKHSVYSSVNLLLSAILSTEDESAFQELKNKFDEKQLQKIMYFAKELAPTNKSGVDFVSFEGSEVFVPNRIVKATKYTRKLLNDRAKSLSKDTEYIQGIGRVDAVDIGTISITIRALYYNEQHHDEIKCKFSFEMGVEELKSYLGRIVEISGYLIKDKSGRYLSIEIDSIQKQQKGTPE